MKSTNTILTGATGTLGLELLPRLIRSDPRQRITLLLRGHESVEVLRRLERITRYTRAFWPGTDLSCVQAVRGDMTEPQLGMRASEYRALQRSVTRIIHSAALTKLDPALEHARCINVGGTENVLEFASGCDHLEQLAHVSTAYVAGDRTGNITEDELFCGQDFLNTYQRSKCEAEMAVRACMGTLPVTVFRPSIIVGDSTDGHIAALDNIYLPLAQVAQGALREIPGSGAARLDLVPVDYVAEAMVRLLRSRNCTGRTYHLTAGRGQAVTARTLVETAIRCAGRNRLQVPLFAEDLNPEKRCEGQAKWPDAQMRRLGVFFAHLSQHLEFDDAQARRDLGSFAESRPRPERFLPRVFAFCCSTQWGKNLDWALPRAISSEEDGHETTHRVEMADSSLDAGGIGLRHAGRA